MKKFAVKSFQNKNLIVLSAGKMWFSIAGIVIIFTMFFSFPIKAQEDLDVPYVSTPFSVVDRMLDIADVGPGDYVIDLGCGDGRIVIEAAKRGAFGHGVDLDPERIKEARKNAREAGVEDKVMFLKEDIFKTDFSEANVVTMYLLASINRKLRPKLLDRLAPGTKIVSHNFSMRDWEPDKTADVDFLDNKLKTPLKINYANDESESYINLDATDNMLESSGELTKSDANFGSLFSLDNMFLGGHDVYYWVVPADAKGEWQWYIEDKKFTMSVDQKFQKIDLQVMSGDASLEIESKNLKGKRISFKAFNPNNGFNYIYNGKIEGDKLTGVIQIRGGSKKSIKNWSATRKTKSSR